MQRARAWTMLQTNGLGEEINCRMAPIFHFLGKRVHHGNSCFDVATCGLQLIPIV